MTKPIESLRGHTYSKFEQEFNKAIDQFKRDHFEAVQETLKELAEETIEAFARESPQGESSGVHFRDSWSFAPYKNIGFIYNEKLSKDGIPLSNLIEYGPRNVPFIMRTFEGMKADLVRKFIVKMQTKLK